MCRSRSVFGLRKPFFVPSNRSGSARPVGLKRNPISVLVVADAATEPLPRPHNRRTPALFAIPRERLHDLVSIGAELVQRRHESRCTRACKSCQSVIVNLLTGCKSRGQKALSAVKVNLSTGVSPPQSSGPVSASCADSRTRGPRSRDTGPASRVPSTLRETGRRSLRGWSPERVVTKNPGVPRRGWWSSQRYLPPTRCPRLSLTRAE